VASASARVDGGDAALGNRLSCFNGLVAVIPQDLPYLSPYPFCTIQPWPISTSLPMYLCIYVCIYAIAKLYLPCLDACAYIPLFFFFFFFFPYPPRRDGVNNYSSRRGTGLLRRRRRRRRSPPLLSASFSFFLPTRLVRKVLTI